MSADEAVVDALAEAQRSLKRVRLFSWVQFGVGACMALLLAVGRIMTPPEAVFALRAVFLVVVLPSVVCASVLVIYHARKVSRPAASWTGELAFWSVMPATTAFVLWVV